jgi:poly(3-hydroxybutyrate) depolymerase
MIMVRAAHLRAGALLATTFLLAACGTSADADPAPPSGAPDASTSPTSDASPSPLLDGGADATPPVSRCQATPSEVTCTSHQLALTAQLLPRDVFYEVPVGTPPAKGWPVAFFFQGSFVAAAGTFVAKKDDSFGLFNMTLTVKELLDHGYAVLAPNAAVEGRTVWQTNIPPWSALWSSSNDDAFMTAIFAAIGEGKFGALDASRLYAMGISSGGFMTSRMAVSYSGKFRALAVHSAGYATCGTTCTLPSALPTDHPPTLFLHGAQDNVAAPSQMELYRDALVAQGHTVQTLLDPTAGHEWLTAGPTTIRTWFDTYP